MLKFRYSVLESTTEELIAMATEVTEVYVIPVLETMPPSETSRAA